MEHRRIMHLASLVFDVINFEKPEYLRKKLNLSPLHAHLFRESRIENLPLTIPGNVTSRIEDKNPITSADVRPKSVDDKNTKIRPAARTDDEKHSNKRESTSRPLNEKVQNDDTPEIPENYEQKNPTKRESNSSSEKNVNEDDDVSEDKNNSRQIRSEDSTASYESETAEPTEVITESVEELIQQTEVYETRTKAPTPRFLSKLSYFKKEDEVRSSIATNLVERNSKRKFKSKCRCEKIWNCGQGKLQITVPRCPNEYFLCC
ncbi:hypothetical protein NE865_13064 [Phthorimaea operculella]|nr:hypothetical protein NE865_13064 [Phthorimaea operculella]